MLTHAKWLDGSTDWQLLICLAVIALASAYIVRSCLAKFRGQGCHGCQSKGCSQSSGLQLVTLQVKAASARNNRDE